jgi:hypothetical protein
MALPATLRRYTATFAGGARSHLHGAHLSTAHRFPHDCHDRNMLDFRLSRYVLSTPDPRQAAAVGSASFPNWLIVDTGDFNGDGESDILLAGRQRRCGDLVPERRAGLAGYGGRQCPIPVWSIQSTNAD